MKQAVCVLVEGSKVGNGASFLAISRRNDPTQWGLPGGKVDPGEASLDAAIREFHEEVGLLIYDSDEYLIPIYCAACPGKGPNDTYWVTTYLWAGQPLLISPGNAAEEGMMLAYKEPAELISKDVSPFWEYNNGVFCALWSMYGGR